MPIHESTSQPSTTLFAKQVWALSKKSLITYWRGANGLFMLIRLALLILIANGTKEEFFERLLVVLTMIYAITVLEDAIQDKTEKYKEFLMIGGVSNLSYLSSMVLLAYFKCILFTVLMYSGYLFLQDGDIYPLRPGQVILLYLIVMITVTNYLLLLSVFFSNKRTGYLLFGFIEFITLFLPNKTKISYAYILFPQKFFFYPKTGDNFIIPTYFSFYGYTSLTFLIGLFYLLLFCLYHVWTIKNGLAKIRKMHPKDTPISNESQSLMDDFRSSTVDSIPSQPTSFSVEITQKDIDTSSALYHEKIQDSETLHQSINFKSVSKSFGSEKVIDNLSFMAYESQIFCLLGHNGAGKTTTINLLTGTLNPDSGEIYYEAQSLHNNLESLRKTIGLCDQQGILYPDLTVEEHLQLISQVRGRSGEELHNEVENIIRKVELDSERTKIVYTLSEGSKRKLSLGLATLCGTRLLFLDEPTIGMDPNTRRRVWDIIKQLRDEGRCIILTTHLLDEAEELADRVGILSKGKLFALGSPEFIKKKFGVGYHLEITPNCDVNCTKEQFEHAALKIQKIIKEHILSAQQEDNQGGDSVKFLLPVSQQHAFPQVFEQLEAFQEIKLNLKMNNLEDAFINIGITDLFQNELTNESLTTERNDQNFNINPPEALKNLIPKYSFLSQINAIWKCNHLLVKRNFLNHKKHENTNVIDCFCTS